jgi:type IV pilus assembly protein PilM
MEMKVLRGKNLPIGLDLGSATIKMVQLHQMVDGLELLAADHEELPRPCQADLDQRLAIYSQSIHKMLARNEFAGRQCVMSLPAEETFVHHVRIPFTPADQLSAAVKADLSGKLPYPADDAIIRHIFAGEVLGDGESKQEIIAIAASRRVLESYLAMTARAKLDVVGVDIESCAVVECFSRVFRRVSDAVSTTLFVDMGAASTQFVLAMGQKIVFARNLSSGGNKIDQALASKMNIAVEAAHALRQDLLKGQTTPEAKDEFYSLLEDTIREIGEEMTQCLRYYESVFRNQVVERAIFVGGQAYDKRLCQSIAQRLNLPAQIGDPLARIRHRDGVGGALGLDWRQPQPAWAVAVGLSLSPTVAA